MRVTKGSPLNLSAARERLGLFVVEADMPPELAELYEDGGQASYEQYYEWQMLAEQGQTTREEAAVVATILTDHHGFAHVPVGYWRHPLSLPHKAIGSILGSLGFARPEELKTANMVGRIVS